MPLSWDFPYPSKRMPVLARNVVATSQPLAAQAGLEMLRCGGNAVDAALAAAVALTVVEPTSNAIGSDAFALLWDGRTLHGLNASGRSPEAWTPERFAGLDAVPLRGWDAVTVPGAVSAWWAMSSRFGILPFESLFEPAIFYAREGFHVSPVTARAWSRTERIFAEFPEFAETFLPGGRAPRPGERFSAPAMAETLEKIAGTRGAAFYNGPLAEKITAQSTAQGGALTLQDLQSHECAWVAPLSVPFRGVHLHELPPNGAGIAALISLGILEHVDLSGLDPDSPQALHLQIEAVKLGLRDAREHVADPASMSVDPLDLIRPDRLEAMAGDILPDRASDPGPGLQPGGGTVYLASADERGMMVSYIQSNYFGFGSGVVVKGTGISLQNRGCGFTLEEGHPNRVAGGKRPFHTIIPGFVTQDGKPLVSFGVMGGPMQPQGHVQLMVRLFAFGQNPQAASDAPRWFKGEDGVVLLETGTPEHTAAGLESRGHEVMRDAPRERFGGAQIIQRLEDGYCAASDPRKDGAAVGY